MSKNFLIENFPSFLTLMSLCCGMSSIKFCLIGEFEYSIVCIIFAGIFDGLDGKIARYLNVCSEFGAQLDSLCDMVNFGVAPIFIIFIWRLNELGFIGWGAVLFGTCSIAIRLARFNCTPKQTEFDIRYSEQFFVGVPSTIASLLYLLPMIIELEMRIKLDSFHIMIYELLISSLCISKLPTLSNKKFRYRN